MSMLCESPKANRTSRQYLRQSVKPLSERAIQVSICKRPRGHPHVGELALERSLCCLLVRLQCAGTDTISNFFWGVCCPKNLDRSSGRKSSNLHGIIPSTRYVFCIHCLRRLFVPSRDSHDPYKNPRHHQYKFYHLSWNAWSIEDAAYKDEGKPYQVIGRNLMTVLTSSPKHI